MQDVQFVLEETVQTAFGVRFKDVSMGKKKKKKH